MPTESPAPTRRVTPESASRLVAIYAARWGLVERTAPAVNWTFRVEVVAGLEHQGGAAWAVVLPIVNTGAGPLPGGEAHVQIRDIDATPIPGFDGDPMLEIRVTVAHELGHCVVAEAVAPTGGALTVPAEEHIVEAAAQALVRSEGTSDARVMARAVRVLPTALRARIAASAGQRARGGSAMDEEMVRKLIEILKTGDSAGALTMCEEELVRLAAAGAAAGTGDPPSAPGAAVAKVEPVAAAGGTPPMDDARRAKGAEMDHDKARARKAADEAETVVIELKAMAAHQRPAQKEALVRGLRARLGSAFKPASEARIMAAPTFTAAQEIAAVIEETIGDVSAERARSGVEHDATPPPKTHSMPTVDTLRTEGFSDSWLTGYASALRSGPDVAMAFLEQGRTSQRARVPQNGAK